MSHVLAVLNFLSHFSLGHFELQPYILVQVSRTGFVSGVEICPTKRNSTLWNVFILVTSDWPSRMGASTCYLSPATCKMGLLAPCVGVLGKEALVVKCCDALIMSVPQIPCLVAINIF